MRRLRGFTLAEALITLALIGVVARLTLPLLNLNVQKQQVGPALMKAINTLKSTNTMALQDNNARRLDEIRSGESKNYLTEILDQYITWSVTLSNANAKTQYGNNDFSSGAYTAPDGISYLRTSSKDSSVQSPPKGYSGDYMYVYVDVNGSLKAPNVMGKDFFVLLVDQAGQVIPYGSHMCKTYGACNATWETKCNKGETPVDAKYCAGAIFDNGGQVKYKY